MKSFRPKKPKPVTHSPRRVRGRAREGASFPTPASWVEIPRGYAEILGEIKTRIQRERLKVVMAANAAMVLLYWDIGNMILKRQKTEGWGAGVIDRLSTDLMEAYPEMKGFSPRNLLLMRGFAEAYEDNQIVKQLVSQLPWGHIVKLLQRVKDAPVRRWYMNQCLEHGWSRSVLDLQLDRRAHQRQGKAVSNFKGTLPPADSDMAHHVFKDPYLFDFLGTADLRRERDLEQGLVAHWQTKMVEDLPKEMKGSLPTVREIEAELASPRAAALPQKAGPR